MTATIIPTIGQTSGAWLWERSLNLTGSDAVPFETGLSRAHAVSTESLQETMPGKKPNQSASFRIRLFADVIGFLLAGLMWCCHARGTSAEEPVSANPDDVTARVGVGGFGRYTTDRWGIARATISNRGDTSASSLVMFGPWNRRFTTCCGRCDSAGTVIRIWSRLRHAKFLNVGNTSIRWIIWASVIRSCCSAHRPAKQFERGFKVEAGC